MNFYIVFNDIVKRTFTAEVKLPATYLVDYPNYNITEAYRALDKVESAIRHLSK